jgi:predicted kinase
VTDQFLLQMAGEPGSGKSALARVIGRRTGAVVLDKDVLKTAALDAGADETLAGGIAYEALFDLADHLLGQGLSVVLDSPSYFETIPSKGQALAAERGIGYHFVECVCEDQAELKRRLAGRPGLDSQPVSLGPFGRATVAPPGAYLRVDTLQPIERCLEVVLELLT